MKKTKEENLFKWSKKRPIWILIIMITLIQVLFVCLLMIGHNYVLPISDEDITILLSIWSGLIASAVGATSVIYISHLQQETQNKFFLEHEANERKRLFLQFYVNQLGHFVEKHQNWISASNYFIKNYSKFEIQDIKWHGREVWDSLVIIYRFNNIFIDKIFEEEWKKLEQQIKFFEKWLDEKCVVLNKGEKPPEIGDEYFSLFYKQFSIILNDISNILMETQKNRILELQELK